MASEERGGKVKVVDRRWFTAEGELREGVEPSPAATTGGAAEPGASPPPGEEVAAPAAPAPVDYSLPPGLLLNVVDFLAQNAGALLTGQVPGIERNPNAARFFIDLLEVVQERTRTQLTIQEARVLDDILFQLRTLAVSPTR